MTWPMHDAGSTTPDPGREEARRQEVRREPWPEEPQPWPEEHGRKSPSRDLTTLTRRAAAGTPPPGPAAADGGPDAGRRTKPGRDDAAAGAQVAGPACPPDPAAPLASPRAARLAGRTARLAPGAQDHRLPASRPAQPRYPQPGYPSRPPGAPGPPGPPGGGPGAGARPPGSPGSTATQRSSLVRSSAGMAVGTLVSRGTGFLRTLVLVYAIGTAGARQRVQQRQHAAERRLLPDARRHLHRRGGPAAGPGGQARPGPRRGLRTALVHPGHAGVARSHRGGDAPGRSAGGPDRRPPSTAPSTT